MSKLYIRGGNPLEGETVVQGAKNAVLPLLAAALLVRGQVTFTHCPGLSDVDASLQILEHLGYLCRREGHRVTVDASVPVRTYIPEQQMRAMRSSIIFLGPMLGRMGEATLSRPGGCELGPRPIDLHLAAMKSLGCQVTEGTEGIFCRGISRGGRVRLPFPSVGATENAMLCAAGGVGDTVILGAAREPEIVTLQEFLNAMGGCVSGAGGDTITIRGGRPLHGGEFVVPGDRMAAATLLSAAAAAGGDVTLQGVDWRQLSPVLATLHQAGCRVDSGGESIRLRRRKDRPLRAVGTISTAPYPGFPTDAQAPVMAALCTARGQTLFRENLFESRFRHVPQLNAMGANIAVSGSMARVRGVPSLHGAELESTDLRGGAALAIAALGAEGESVLGGLHHLDRGYESLETTLTDLGGIIYRR